jgi:hypothetical protein
VAPREVAHDFIGSGHFVGNGPVDLTVGLDGFRYFQVGFGRKQRPHNFAVERVAAEEIGDALKGRCHRQGLTALCNFEGLEPKIGHKTSRVVWVGVNSTKHTCLWSTVQLVLKKKA